MNNKYFSTIKVVKNGKERLVKLPLSPEKLMAYQVGFAGRKGSASIPRRVNRRILKETKKDQLAIVWHTVIGILDIDFKDAQGNPVESFEAKKNVLQSNGITDHHLKQILLDADRLIQERMK